ncbi:S53 family peptidase [Actinacidiphila acidipaludis]|uniref:Peptidase S8 n=1 Tax=Actinacidiphila acidipaludis TaxID=2873382 RepID=A0ABS7QF92_9ACTN|nr:peptidase S8 [Streptomyces acidipaludis]MBY8881826.1 peptidase S8 [Streptomyces acidipaludis]
MTKTSVTKTSVTKNHLIRPLAGAVAVAGTVVGLVTAVSPTSFGAGDDTAGAAAPVSVCSTPPPGQLACQAEVMPDHSVPGARSFTARSGAALPAGYGPADIQSAYAVAADVRAHAGKGRTVAIVDAYDAPTAEADLAVYRATYGLPACTTANGCFRKVNQRGDAAPLPQADPSWAVEISLDVDAVSAACPDCDILLVEGDMPAAAALAESVDTAVRLGAAAVSNSYSAAESAVTDNDLTAKGGLPASAASYAHPGVPILAASGDSGFQLDAPYPADLTSVIAVGGTSLSRSDAPRGWTETAWGPVQRPSGAGAACSAHVDKPSWQHDAACPGRTVADISADADPYTGLAVYDSTPDPADGLPGGWLRAGGTSAATPLVSAMYVMAGPAAGVKGAAGLYTHRDHLDDVAGGASVSIPGSGHECPASSTMCAALPGYDAPTGLGSPDGLASLRY